MDNLTRLTIEIEPTLKARAKTQACYEQQTLKEVVTALLEAWLQSKGARTNG